VNPQVAFDPLRLLRELNDAGVRYVVIGAFAGRLLGSPTLTRDLDICYARDRANLEALSGVLRALHARLRGVDEDLPFQLDARALAAGDSFTFVTIAGDLDILGTPQGTTGYDDLVRTATKTDLDGLVVLVSSIDDLIRMKRAAGRPKDLIEVEVLAAVRDELDRDTI
jgi:predicted nucleotidyltransferase